MNNSEFKAYLQGLSENDRKALLAKLVSAAAAAGQPSAPGAKQAVKPDAAKPAEPAPVAWFDRKICGLSKEGLELLKELEEQKSQPLTARNVEIRQLNYCKALKKMKLKVPKIFRSITNADSVTYKSLYAHLHDYCVENDIPDEIIDLVIPSLVDYMVTGRMRPIIFVGEKGCGKTTAVKMLVQEALKLPTEIIKIPQTSGSHGLTGDCNTYKSADAGAIVKARLKCGSLLVAYIFDEIDKVPGTGNSRASVSDELLSITDESNDSVMDNYLESTIVGLEHCPMFFTANEAENINPILMDRCTVIRFPNASADRIKSIMRKYADKKLSESVYRELVTLDYDKMDNAIDYLIDNNVTSLRKHQQMLENALNSALRVSLAQKDNEGAVCVTEPMFRAAEEAVVGIDKGRLGFSV